MYSYPCQQHAVFPRWSSIQVLSLETPSTYTGKREGEPTLNPLKAGSSSKPRRKKPRTRTKVALSSTPKRYDAGATTTAPEITKKRETHRRAGPETLLIKPAQGSSFANILRDLKKKVKLDTLGVKIEGVRETRKGEILFEVGPAEDGRTKLSSAIRGVVAVGNSMRELVHRMEVEVLDLDTTTDVEEVTEAVCDYLRGVHSDSVKVCLKKRAFRGYLKPMWS